MNSNNVYVVDGARTPFLKMRVGPGPFSASDLAVQAGRDLIARQPFLATQLDEVIIGCAIPSVDEINIGRVISLRLGCGYEVPAWTVMRNCASGMQALDSAMGNIQLGRADLVLAGGVDALSRAPLVFSENFTIWLSRLTAAKSSFEKIKLLQTFRPSYIKPVIGLLKGLTDPVIGLSMGQTAENLAMQFGISRQTMDSYSERSHRLTLQAQQAKVFDIEITPLIDANGKTYLADDGVRSDSTVERLGKLRPVFDPKGGSITAGNSSQISDGATVLLLASEAAVKKWQLNPLGRIIDRQWAGLDPARMGLGPVHAATPILQRQGMTLNQPDLWEINEAFAAQVLACLAAWKDESYCQKNFASPAFGELDKEKLNIDGGAIAIGHPVGASGARIVLHLLHSLRRKGLKLGIASICIGGGQGGAMLVEAFDTKSKELLV